MHDSSFPPQIPHLHAHSPPVDLLGCLVLLIDRVDHPPARLTEAGSALGTQLQVLLQAQPARSSTEQGRAQGISAALDPDLQDREIQLLHMRTAPAPARLPTHLPLGSCSASLLPLMKDSISLHAWPGLTLAACSLGRPRVMRRQNLQQIISQATSECWQQGLCAMHPNGCLAVAQGPLTWGAGRGGRTCGAGAGGLRRAAQRPSPRRWCRPRLQQSKHRNM